MRVEGGDRGPGVRGRTRRTQCGRSGGPTAVRSSRLICPSHAGPRGSDPNKRERKGRSREACPGRRAIATIAGSVPRPIQERREVRPIGRRSGSEREGPRARATGVGARACGREHAAPSGSQRAHAHLCTSPDGGRHSGPRAANPRATKGMYEAYRSPSARDILRARGPIIIVCPS